MFIVLILSAFFGMPYNYAMDTCNLHSDEVCCVWSYDICDIQPTEEELGADPNLNKASELWCFSPFRLKWEEDPMGPYPMDDHEAFLRYASPEELEQAKKYWNRGEGSP